MTYTSLILKLVRAIRKKQFEAAYDILEILRDMLLDEETLAA